MENKQIEVDCPCCSTRLTVDVLTRTVMRAISPQEREESDPAKRATDLWDGAKQRVDDRGGGAQERLDSALSAEKGKESRLDDLFDQAREKVNRRKPDLDE
ncbi:MAG: uncharacterized Zn finger protein (UPF0148 family) [Candidatus Paceibacteria bacterium]|jgi:uncharacterized Zn finger protein (UPF0148 family)